MNDQTGDDAALQALDALRVQLDRTIRDLRAADERLEQLARLRTAGMSWSEIVAKEDRPLVVEIIATVLADLGESGSRFRREEALALQNEKVSITSIGQLFGVSRQRISTILRGQGTGRRGVPRALASPTATAADRPPR